LALAAEHYRKAWAIQPDKRGLLVDLGRVLRSANKMEEAQAVLVAASRGSETRAAESARELLPARYPWVNEFRRAMEIDSRNVPLRRDLAFLLLQMERRPEAEREFRAILDLAPDDPLSCAQLGFLLLARGETGRALPLLERVMKEPDTALAARVRGYMRTPQRSDAPPPVSGDPKVMAGRSLDSGYLQDALRYLQTAFEADRQDPWVHLKLGWTYNLLHDDRSAIRWFDQARRANDAGIAAEGERAYRNLRPSLARIRTTAWMFPFFSSRWRDVFSYAQVKTEFHTGTMIRPYLSVRLLGDVRRSTGGALPVNLSENSMILAGGLASQYWRGLMGWVEAGQGLNYITGRMKPDYRGGLSYGAGFGPGVGAGAAGPFFETNADGVYISRFQHDLLTYSQNRLGFTPEMPGEVRAQIYWSANVTVDTKRLEWANFIETGPGVRLRIPSLARSLLFSVDLVRGAYTVPQRGLRAPNFFDFRAGFWYAATH
jgi:tetratricopeptide (TPR) repeat protein